MDYFFNIIITQTGILKDMYGIEKTISFTKTISNNILHVGCFGANFTGWNNQTDVPLNVNELNTDIFKLFS